MRPWFAVLAALCLCLPARSQQSSVTTSAAPGAAPAAQGAAPPPRSIYRVELVVFRARDTLGSPEDWGTESGATGVGPAAGAPGPGPGPGPGPDTDPGNSGAESAEQRSVVHLLPHSEFQLEGVEERLRSSGRYLPVAHVAWSQTASPWGRPVELPVQSLGIDAPGLNGTVSLQLGDFLHLELSLNYAMDDPPPGLGAAPGTVFSLHDMHRVRLNERNYFDHPAFGVIALVTPLQTSHRARR